MDESQHTSSGVAMPSFFEEFRLYHRKDGCVVKVGDDLISATRYGIMELRSAMPAKGYDWRNEIERDVAAQLVVGDSKNTITLARSSADVSPP
jgi:hypothetical protein